MTIRTRLNTLENANNSYTQLQLHVAFNAMMASGELPEHPPTAVMCQKLKDALDAIDQMDDDHDH